MKKKNDLNEFLKQLREAIENMLDESGTFRPIIVDVSVNICPNLDVMPASICVVKAEKVPVDIIETEKKILATIGLSGIEKDNIMISCNGKVLEINASNAMKTLNERIELPSKVVKKGMKATFNNGILEVVFNKSKRKSIKKE